MHEPSDVIETTVATASAEEDVLLLRIAYLQKLYSNMEAAVATLTEEANMLRFRIVSLQDPKKAKDAKVTARKRPCSLLAKVDAKDKKDVRDLDATAGWMYILPSTASSRKIAIEFDDYIKLACFPSNEHWQPQRATRNNPLLAAFGRGEEQSAYRISSCSKIATSDTLLKTRFGSEALLFLTLCPAS
ncbi:hypothetical protein BBJ28_00023142 [Nothophytophthora sp. Chile5]|nr:hypothetical protein BBJ28_00023142 [Nothophytophthora sp. Chile5]